MLKFRKFSKKSYIISKKINKIINDKSKDKEKDFNISEDNIYSGSNISQSNKCRFVPSNIKLSKCKSPCISPNVFSLKYL